MGLLRRAPENPIQGPWALDETLASGPAIQVVDSGPVALVTLDVTPDAEQDDTNGVVIVTGEVNAILSASDDLVVVVGVIAAGLTDVVTVAGVVAVGPPVQTGFLSVPVQVEISLAALVAFGAPPWTVTLQGDVAGAATATYEANSCHLRVGLVERPSPRRITLV